MNLNLPRSSYVSLQNMKYATMRYHGYKCYDILFIPGEIKNIFLFAAGWNRKKFSPGWCAGNKAIYFFGLRIDLEVAGDV